jgi:hypothetical protein
MTPGIIIQADGPVGSHPGTLLVCVVAVQQ